MSGFEGPIHVVVGSSRRRVALAALAHALAMVCVLVALAPGALAGALALGVFANGVCVCRRLCARADAVAAVLLDAGDRWRVTLGDGRVLAAELAGDAFVSVPLTAFTLRCADGRRRHVVLLDDAAGAPARRRLRVRMRHARTV
ncbi:MAG: protein YgfX [Gammaproteobacteria bacterium]